MSDFQFSLNPDLKVRMTEEETDIFLRLTTFPFSVQAPILILFDGYDLRTVVREQSSLPSVTMS